MGDTWDGRHVVWSWYKVSFQKGQTSRVLAIDSVFSPHIERGQAPRKPHPSGRYCPACCGLEGVTCKVNFSYLNSPLRFDDFSPHEEPKASRSLPSNQAGASQSCRALCWWGRRRKLQSRLVKCTEAFTGALADFSSRSIFMFVRGESLVGWQTCKGRHLGWQADFGLLRDTPDASIFLGM